jgi:gliding motility-associated-like protein
MKKTFCAVFFCLTYIAFSQSKSDSIVVKQNIIKNKKKSYRINKNILTNPVFTYCDTDSDGFLEINLNEIINYVLSENSYLLGIEEGIYISTSGNSIKLVTDLDTSPIITNVCNSTLISLLDIAVSQNNEYYIAKNSTIYKLTSTCGIDIDYNFNTNNNPITSLSFDRLNNLYMGGFDSKVYRLNNGNYGQMEMWHDFVSGKAGGDFVMYNEKMYISWNSNDIYNLLEVTVDTNNDYISHTNLGTIPNQTFGLASELGTLYGITPNQLYKISIPNLSIETVLVNTSTLDWYGAAGKNEAVNFVTNAFAEQIDAQNNENALPIQWTNTISGGQTIYVSITETVNNQNIIIPVDIIINTAPTYTNPVTLANCASSSNPYEFNIRATESDILGSQTNISVNYYGNPNDAINNTNPLSDVITITSSNKIIYVKLINTLTDCSTTFSFNLKVESNPVFNQPKDLVFCNSQNSINIPITLSDQTNTILGNQLNTLFVVSYYDSMAEAEMALNPFQNNYILTTNTKEIFCRIESLTSGCYSTGSFNATVLQESINSSNSNFSISNTDWTANNNSIQIYIDDSSSYVFSIDGINYQTENFFNNLLPGEYNIYIKNITTCVINIESVLILMYPNFFTPNNDGNNDLWYIKDAFKEENLQVSIFDRYGKLIKSLKNNEIGWDGTYNNHNLPATDYWFTVTRKNGKIYKGHFSLIR